MARLHTAPTNLVPLSYGIQAKGRSPIAQPKTCESNFVHHNFVQFGKQNSQIKAILSSIILSQQRCEANYISLAA